MARPAARGRILICPTAFKGTVSAIEAAACLARGARALGLSDDDIVLLPLSDGGNGLLDALDAHVPGLARGSAEVTGPFGAPVRAGFLSRPGMAVVESAEACGLHLVAPGRLDPLAASTFGVGELVRAALAEASRKAAGSTRPGADPPEPASPGGQDSGGDDPAGRPRLVLGLGGSATVDGGAGMARALGWRLLDGAGRDVPAGGAGLAALRRIRPPAGRHAARSRGRAPGGPADDVVALADVRNPLVGPDGAAAVFGPQKGADPGAVALLEDGLANLAERLRTELGVDVGRMAGAGAAGGLGAGAVAFLGARLAGGAEWVLEALGFDAHLRAARTVLTGEGAYDGQSGMGKVVGVVVERASAAGLPVVVVAGRATAAPRPGVVVRSGDGRLLDARALAGLAADGLAEALAEASG